MDRTLNLPKGGVQTWQYQNEVPYHTPAGRRAFDLANESFVGSKHKTSPSIYYPPHPALRKFMESD